MAAPATGTRASARRPPARVIRYNRPTRWYHAAIYLTVTVLLITGWWLRTGHEGRPSLLADVAGAPDTDIHRRAGWVLVGIATAGVTLGARAAWTFVRETLRADRGDGRWLRRWPLAVLTGRFAPHKGRFDPGQRLANVVFVGGLGTVIVSGVALTQVSAGPTFATMVKVHRGATYVLTAMVIGHVLVAAGVLPGYRGVWRSMHLGGRARADVVRRLWPADAPTSAPHEAGASDRSGAGLPGSDGAGLEGGPVDLAQREGEGDLGQPEGQQPDAEDDGQHEHGRRRPGKGQHAGHEADHAARQDPPPPLGA